MENQSGRFASQEQSVTTASVFASSRFIKIFDYVFLLRPTLFIPVWTVFASGMFAAGHVDLGSTYTSVSPWMIAVGLTMIMGSAFILNQVIDAETDKLNNKLFLIANGHVAVPTALFATVLLFTAGTIIAWIHGLIMLGIFVTIYLVTGIFYSVPIFAWKDKPTLGLIANASGAVLIFVTGWIAVMPATAFVWIKSLPYAAAVTAVYLLTTLLDITGDRAVNKRTIGVVFGVGRTTKAACICASLSLLWAGLFDDGMILLPAAASVPFFLWSAIKPHRLAINCAIKVPILLLALAVGLKMPFLVVMILFTFLGSKWYYGNRFGLTYPRLD